MATTSSTGAAAAGGAFPPFDASTFASQLFWLAVTFGLLYWLMSRIALPRIGTILADRAARIEADLAAAAKARDATEEAASLYEKALSDARADSQKLAQKTRDQLAASTDANRKTLEADLAKKLVRAEATIAKRKSAAMENVHAIAADVTLTIVEQVTGKATTSARVEAALEATLAKPAH